MATEREAHRSHSPAIRNFLPGSSERSEFPCKRYVINGSTQSRLNPAFFSNSLSFLVHMAFVSLFLVHLFGLATCTDEMERVKLPSKCETCKYLSVELAERFGETGKTHQTIESAKGVVKKYKDSELRFLETMEGVCDRILRYNMHKEHENSARFAKGMSETMKTLHGLKDKGVKVELGIPDHLWDSPSVEVTRMKQECEDIVSDYEDDLEVWYMNERKETSVHDLRESLEKFLCVDRVLKTESKRCLWEEPGKEKAKGDREEL